MPGIKNRMIKYGMQSVLSLTAFIAKRESLLPINNGLLRELARRRASRVHKKPVSVRDLGMTWQEAFPSKKQIPLVNVTEDTAYAEIHTPCPLRGTNDLKACYRMMEYDRAFLARFGGTLVVTESQASEGVQKCKVAIQYSNAEASA